MKFNALMDYIEHIYDSPFRTKVNIILEGPPATGKSAIFHTIAKKRKAQGENFRLIDLRVSMLSRTELMGIPFPDKKNKTMEFFQLTFYLRTVKESSCWKN